MMVQAGAREVERMRFDSPNESGLMMGIIA
jgi:hypothetical protein